MLTPLTTEEVKVLDQELQNIVSEEKEDTMAYEEYSKKFDELQNRLNHINISLQGLEVRAITLGQTEQVKEYSEVLGMIEDLKFEKMATYEEMAALNKFIQ